MKKKMLSFMLAVVMIFSVVSAAISVSGAAEVIGDVDGDGELSIFDATAIQRHLAAIDTLDDAVVKRGLVDGDDELSILDATAIQRRLAGIIKYFPVEMLVPEPDTQPSTEAPTQAATDAPAGFKTIYVGVISYLVKDLGTDDYYVHYWGGKTAGDAPLYQQIGKFEYKYVGYWTGQNQMFVMFAADIPADSTGFKVHYNYERWFGEDGDAAQYNKAWVFNYDGDKAVYEHVYIEEPPTEPPTQAPTQAPTQPSTQPDDEPGEVTEVKNNITVYFSDNKHWGTVNAYVYNYASGQAMTGWPGLGMTYVKTNNEGEKVYSTTVDVSKYDRIIFNNGSDQTTDTPVTKASSGYFINSEKSYGGKYLAGVYPYGQDGEGKVTTISMDYPDGYKKKIYIWTPEGYNAADKTKKYHVLYMCDGQNLFGQAATLSGYEWEVDESVLSMMGNGGDGVIVVGVEAGTTEARRNHELTPNLGTISAIASGDPTYNNGGGKVFNDFVVGTVMPYVEANYNVTGVRGIAGSSSGGIEAFYIGMENPDKFSYIGALSPAFILYDKATWDNYLKTKDFSGDMPRIYFFCGKSEQDLLEQALYTNAVAMQGWMEALGYPADKMVTFEDNDATHSEGFWAIYFPEMLSFGLDL